MQIASGERVACIGESGSGKSTLLRLIAGVERLDQGLLNLRGQVISSSTVHVQPELRKLGWAPQDMVLFPHLSVQENVAFAMDVTPPQSRLQLQSLLDRFGLLSLANALPAQLSGGQQRRVVLARTFGRDADLYLLDEPLAHLDPALRDELSHTISLLLEEKNAACLWVTHHLPSALPHLDQVCILHQGQLIAQAPPKELFNQTKSSLVAHHLEELSWVTLPDLPSGLLAPWLQVLIDAYPPCTDDFYPPKEIALQQTRWKRINQTSATSIPARVSTQVFKGQTTSLSCFLPVSSQGDLEVMVHLELPTPDAPRVGSVVRLSYEGVLFYSERGRNVS